MNALSKAEQNALQVSYDVLGTHVELDLNFVKQYLVRGRAEYVTDQELVFFMNTCKMQGLNPLVSGEVYLIKYSKEAPAQMVVGKDAFLRRAYNDPNYLSKTDGITVQRGEQIIQKEGCCIYPGEKLIGGWCKVTYLRGGKERTAFREVSTSEYSSGMANWKSKPATMINKVAISQCIRDAFPKEYEGLYTEDEMVASGAIPATATIDADYKEVHNGGKVVTQEDPIITNEQRKDMFRLAQKHFGEEANNMVKEIIGEIGLTSTSKMKLSEYNKAMASLQERIEKVMKQQAKVAEAAE